MCIRDSIYTDRATAGTENLTRSSASVTILINELLAENDATLQDPSGLGFPDWFELYNPTDVLVDLSGMHLTDDESLPTQWKIPEGVTIEAKGFLLFWADNDEEQGDTHTNFKLSSKGETIALFDTDINGNVLIDRVEFGEQISDISYGR